MRVFDNKVATNEVTKSVYSQEVRLLFTINFLNEKWLILLILYKERDDLSLKI